MNGSFFSSLFFFFLCYVVGKAFGLVDFIV